MKNPIAHPNTTSLNSPQKPRRAFLFSLGIVGMGVIGVFTWRFGDLLWWRLRPRILGRRSVEDVQKTLRPHIGKELQKKVNQSGLVYPPKELLLVAFKEERELRVWGRNTPEETYALIEEYPILAASGSPGPKLREGDKQVPEGIYRTTALNPNSRFYLSIKLSYPNSNDRKQARLEGRKNLGGDIFIHGSAVSVGCIAIGNKAIGELFLLLSDSSLPPVRVLITPWDLRYKDAPIDTPVFMKNRYDRMKKELETLSK